MSRCSLLLTLPLMACRGDSSDPTISEIEISIHDEISTLATVRWTTSEPVSTWVEVGETTEYEREPLLSAATETEHELLILGLAPETLYHLRIGLEADDETIYSEDVELETLYLPNFLPEITVESLLPEQVNGGYYIGSILANDQAIIALFDADGNYTWWGVDETTNHWSTRARLAPDGSGVLYNLFDRDGATESSLIVHLSWTGEVLAEHSLPFSHHDFSVLDDGSIAAIVQDHREWDGVVAHADAITIIDPDHSQSQIWSAWDHLEPPPDLVEGADWTHANSIRFLPDEDAYYLGAYKRREIYKIDRESGELLWTLGDTQSDWEMADDGSAWFNSQHQFELLDDGILLFDNRTELDTTARVVEYAWDTDSMVLSERWSYEEDPPLYCYVLGDVQRLSNGNTMAVWSTSGQISEVGPDRDLVWQLNLEIGAVFAYIDQVDSLPQP